MKKVLFVATLTNHINAFHIPYLKLFKENGYEVHVASNGNEKIKYCDIHFDLPFERFPLKLKNFKTFKQLKKIISENDYEIIHSNTPVGGVIARLAARESRKKGTRSIYTAHGFHFYKGAPLLNWLLYYPIEKICARWTDCLITINKEDYQFAKSKFKKCKNINYINGIGVDFEKFNKSISWEEKNKIKKTMGLKDNDFIIIFAARLEKNKNQILLINAMEMLIKEYNNIHLLLPGKDNLGGLYQKIVCEKKLEQYIHFLGFRNDIDRLLKVSDIAVSTSIREGFGINIVEALASNVPVIATNNRGHREIIKNGINGYLIELNVRELYEKIKMFVEKKSTLENLKESIYDFSIDSVMKKMKIIYGFNN